MVYRTSVFGLLALALLVSGVSVSASRGMAGVRERQVNEGINGRRDTLLLAQPNVNENKSFGGTFQSCKRTGPSVKCSVVVRSTEHGWNTVLCQNDNVTRLFDLDGNVYPCAKVQIGNKTEESQLSAFFSQGTPVRVTLTFNNVTSQVNDFDTLELHFGGCAGCNLGSGFLVFRNIKLPR
ncbi:MAG: hypothetical protein RPG89_09900 [Microcystis panniformis WG22]|nr:hypothetical protein [Microcystis panniformis WG22]